MHATPLLRPSGISRVAFAALIGLLVACDSDDPSPVASATIDAATGDEAWRTSYPAPFSVDPAAAADPHGPGPKATPAFADGRLYTLGLGGMVTAFDLATGDIVWQAPAPPVGPLYGTAASPLAWIGS